MIDRRAARRLNRRTTRNTLKMKKSKHMAKMVADSSTSIENTSIDIGMKENTCGVMRVYTHNSSKCRHENAVNIPHDTHHAQGFYTVVLHA